jgi:hypothetical protein
MSYVAGVILVFKVDGREDEDVLADVNTFFGCGGLVDVTLQGGGSKHPQMQVAVGGFNYLDIPAFLVHLRAVDWGGGYGWADVAIQNEHDNGVGWLHIYRGPDADAVGLPWSESR